MPESRAAISRARSVIDVDHTRGACTGLSSRVLAKVGDAIDPRDLIASSR
jgi:hypothetical protein